MKPLVDLPKDIWCGKIIQFVHVYDLVRLESAVSNHGDRDVLLRNISGANLTDFIIDENDHNTIPWLVSHNILPLRVTLEKPVHLTCEKWIDLFFSQAKDLHFNFRGEIKNLRDIIGASFKTVSSICIKGSVLHSLGSVAICRKLSSLHLIGCEEIDEHELTESLRNCNIYDLKIHDPSQLSDQFFTDIFALLPSLRSLELISLRNWDPILNGITGQTNIRRFDCEYGTVGSATITAIARCMPLLEVLILGGNVERREQPQVLESDIDLLVRSCPRITELALMQLPTVGDAAAASIARHLPSLESLTLMLCTLSDVGLGLITSHCALLRSISLPLVFKITDAGIRALGLQCTRLEHLDVQFDWNLTDGAFDTLNTATLRSINLSKVNLTGEFMKSLFREGSVLTRLTCDSNRSNFSTFVNFLSPDNRLQELSLTRGTWTQPEWMELSCRLSRLRRLNLSGCSAVDEEVVRSFVEHNPQLLTFTLHRCREVPRQLFQEFACLRDLE